tara:strand:+ start:2496 stop:2921 length:426 start_codon:yes stop_codon:yes gene_type:complete
MRLFVFLFIVSIVGNVVFTIKMSQAKNVVTPIVEQNSETMSEMAHVFDLLLKNTDVMMRYGHYLDEHDPLTELVPFCPECTGSEDNILPIEVGDPEILSSDIDQLMSDSKEFYAVTRRIKSSLYNQSFKLKHTLSQLKELK